MVENFEKPQTTNAHAPEAKGVTLADAKLHELPKPGASNGAHVPDVTLVDGGGIDDAKKLYKDSGSDESHQKTFASRLDALSKSDPEAYKELGDLGKKLNSNPPPTPEQVGEDLGKLYVNSIVRQNEKAKSDGGSVDLQSLSNQNLMGAMSSYMIAETSKFAGQSPQEAAKNTTAMVDAVEAQIQKNGVPYAHSIIWGDTKQPGMVVTSPGFQKFDRHNFDM